MAILSNKEIHVNSKSNGLIRSFDPNGLCGASYELRCSPIYYDLTENKQRIDASQYGSKILIKPKHTVVLIVAESVDIPQDMTAQIIGKGSLFSIGLSPICTYADPGFNGQLGLVTTNNSDKYILLDVLQSVAKIHFSQLTSNSTILYRGQHGYQSQVWVIRDDLQKEYKDVKNDQRMKSEEEEANIILPRHTAVALEHMAAQNKTILRILAIAFIFNALFFYFLSTNRGIETIANIGINLLSSAIVGLISLRNLKRTTGMKP